MARTPTKAKPVEFSTTSRLKKSGGSQVLVEAAPNQTSVVKVRKPKYSLDELIAGYDADDPTSPWQAASTQGTTQIDQSSICSSLT